LLLLAAVLGTGAALSQARAAPLDAETCTKLMIEQGALEKAGVEQDMAKGVEWAKANLGLEKLGQVRRFIELEEQIVFRCRSKSLVTLPPDPETEPQEKDQDKDKDKQAKDDHDKQETVVPKSVPKATPPPAGAKDKAAAKPEPKQKPQPAKKPTDSSAATKAGDPKAQPKKQDAAASKAAQKSPPKAKVDDAAKATDLKQ
jgi:outer membrane biosynthesis protein TonB